MDGFHYARTSFFLRQTRKRHSPSQPADQITLALSIIFVAFTSPWYWTPTFLLLLVIVPLCFFGQVAREFFRTALRVIIPAWAFIFLMQAFFQPIGKPLFLNSFFWM